MRLKRPILELLEEFLSEQTLSEATLITYEKNIRLFVVWATKNCRSVSELGRADFVIYYNSLVKSGKSAKTLDNYTAALRAFYRWLIEYQYYDIDITQGTRNKRKTSEYVRAPLNIEQADQLLQSCKGDSIYDKRNYAIVNIMLWLGLRRCEVCRLNIRDIFIQENNYYIRIQGKGRIDKDEVLRVTDDIRKPIEDYWALRTDRFGPNTAAFISHARRGEVRLTPGFISKLVKCQLRMIGLDDRIYSSHSLRHTAAILAMKAGASVDQVRSMLRHRSASITELYLKVLERDQQAGNTAILALGNYYRKHKETRQKGQNSINISTQ